MTLAPWQAPSGRDAALAISLVNLLHLRLWGEVLAVATPDAYFSSVANTDVAAVMLNILLLSVVLLGLVTLARRFGAPGRRVIVAGFALMLLLQFNAFGPLLAPGVFTIINPWLDAKYVDALLPLLGLLLIALASRRWPTGTLRLARGTVLMLAPLALWFFGRGLLTILQVNPTDALAARVPAVGARSDSAQGPRVVLLLMDAMSRRLAFDARPADLELPALDRLRAEGLDATNVEQAGWVTKVSVPEILSGVPVRDSRPVGPSELELTLEDGSTQAWSTAPNLLKDAKEAGGVAVVAGWYHPYCRIFTYLDGCATYPARTVGARGRHSSFGATMWDQALALIPYINLRRRQIDIVEEHRQDLARAAVQGGRGLVFLHVIVPHTPWIWDEEAGDYTLTSYGPDGYFGNLALADDLLGEIREAMEDAGQWDSAAVVLVSDHVMRYRPDYLNEPDDRRVPLIVKLPGSTVGGTYDQPLSASITHQLVEALLRGELKTNHALVAWFDSTARPREP
ncbi:MAG: sulfatase-like hydrolase/transferase [Gemmatimonadaceae bacterium]|nr:sulfatase-like hydrolase/transferase [Gemmatimonadaceae bacterium]MCW5827446.1 sulfatase-like hydrolase/transferase [Gemmatimonadaceae bacterium]